MIISLMIYVQYKNRIKNLIYYHKKNKNKLLMDIYFSKRNHPHYNNKSQNYQE